MDFRFSELAAFLVGWPLIIVVVAAGILCTLAFSFVQVRYFGAAWKYFFSPEESTQKTGAEVTPVQALMNALNSNLGNGTIAGIAVALYKGGPGAAMWLLVIGLLLMAVRFAEVFLSTHYAAKAPAGTKVGGPMLYLADLPGGSIWPYVYAIMCFAYGLVGANAYQVNAITNGMQKSFNFSANGMVPYLLGAGFFAFVIYVMLGGAQRIMRASETLVPIKVGVFLVSTIIILTFYASAIIPAIGLMVSAAFSWQAFTGGVLGYSIQMAMRQGAARVVMATESGLGTTGIMFGSTKSVSPVKDAIMSMLSTFITTVIGFIMALTIVATGVWNNGETATALTMSSFETVFGQLGGWLVLFLAAAFGLGVVVAYAYVAQETWTFLTKGSFMWLFIAIYCATTFIGCIVPIDAVLSLADFLLFFMFLINICGIFYLLPVIRKGLADFGARRTE